MSSTFSLLRSYKLNFGDKSVRSEIIVPRLMLISRSPALEVSDASDKRVEHKTKVVDRNSSSFMVLIIGITGLNAAEVSSHRVDLLVEFILFLVNVQRARPLTSVPTNK